jgi:predicted DNA-binding protein
VSKVISLKIDEKLLQKLEQTAKAKGVSKSFLVRKGVEIILQESEDLDVVLVQEATEALKAEKSLPKDVNWQLLKKELAASVPRWGTLKEAMQESRKRLWHE